MTDASETFGPHDHALCRATALAQAEALCAERGARLTPIRRRTLELLLESHRPIGAYDLIDKLAAEGARPHPPTVYRALDFLIEHGLAHRMRGAASFVACQRPAEPQTPHFLICRACGETRELSDPALAQALAEALRAAAFAPSRISLEVEGVCAPCRRAQ